MRFALCALVLVFLAATAFAASGTISCQLENESQVSIAAASDSQPELINISVLVFNPAVSAGGTSSADVWQGIIRQCAGDQTCMAKKSLEYDKVSTSYRFVPTTLPNAPVTVYYYSGGQWLTVPGCENLRTDSTLQGTMTSPTGVPQSYTYYYAQCDITPAVKGNTQTQIRAVYEGTDKICSSFWDYEYDNAKVTPSSAFAQQMNNFIRQVAEGGGAGISSGTTLPCVGVFLIMGLLLASLYFAGKSPISLLDITTPRLPTPKGVTASGQILAPFG